MVAGMGCYPALLAALRTLKGCLVGTADHFAPQKRQPFLRRYRVCSRHNNCTPQGSNRKPTSTGYLLCGGRTRRITQYFAFGKMDPDARGKTTFLFTIKIFKMPHVHYQKAPPRARFARRKPCGSNPTPRNRQKKRPPERVVFSFVGCGDGI